MMAMALLVVVGAVLLSGIGRLRAVRQAALDQRRSTIRALRRFRVFLERGASGGAGGGGDNAVTADVRQALIDLLHLDDCWFEPHQRMDHALPELDAEGNLSGLIQRWVDDGLVLPTAVAIPAERGRYVLVGRPDIGTTLEQRMLANAVVAASAARASVTIERRSRRQASQ